MARINKSGPGREVAAHRRVRALAQTWMCCVHSTVYAKDKGSAEGGRKLGQSGGPARGCYYVREEAHSRVGSVDEDDHTAIPERAVAAAQQDCRP